MAIMEIDRESLRCLVTEAVTAPTFRRATFGGVPRSESRSPWSRVVVRPIELRGERHLQFTHHDGRKDFTRNYSTAEVFGPLAEVLAVEFSGIHVVTDTEEIDLRTTKKGKVLVGRRAVNGMSKAAPEPHNRVKDVPLPEGKADRLLEVMGIASADGRVRPTMRAKFTQINEFLKQLQHSLVTAGLDTPGDPVEILDCGCGSSYLTLAAHHYLNDVLGIPARVMGVDVNEEVIRKSIEKGERLGNGPSFACGRIGGLKAKPDVVLALHACDTATDDAIAQAIRGEARLLLSVPCCHHALNRELSPQGSAEVLRPMLRHGILRERTADLVTDAFRALALRIMGYRTDVVEFVSTEHTARNLMIRAVRGAPRGDAAPVAEFHGMKQFWGVTPYIETALGEPFRLLLGGERPA
jgi:hypothetical protein